MSNCTDKFQIVYLYKKNDLDLYSNESTLDIVDAAAKIFSIDNNIKKIDVYAGYDELDDIIVNIGDDNRVIIYTNFNSKALKDLELHLESIAPSSKYYIVAPKSSADDPVLNQKHICRLHPPDDNITAQIYVDILNDESTSDNYVIIVDESPWSLNFADLISSLLPDKRVVITNINQSDQLPTGTLNILAILSMRSEWNMIMDNLKLRENDIINLLLAGGETFVPRTQEELNLVRKWKTTAIMAGFSLDDNIFVEEATKILGYAPNLPIAFFSSGMQVASYLKNSICPLQKYNVSDMMIGLRFGRNMNNNIYFFAGMRYRLVGMFATERVFVKFTAPQIE